MRHVPEAQTAIDRFIEEQSRVRISTQQSTVDGAKAVAIFSCGVATTLASTTLQVGNGVSVLDGAVMALLLVTFLGTLAVFLLDNLTDGPNMAEIASAAAGDQQVHLDGLLTGLLAAVLTNTEVVVQVLRMTLLQCLTCGAVVGLTVLSVAS